MMGTLAAPLSAPPGTCPGHVNPHCGVQIHGLTSSSLVLSGSSPTTPPLPLSAGVVPARKRRLSRLSLRTGVAFSSIEQRDVSTAALSPPEIAEDAPLDLLSALESQRFKGDYYEPVADTVESPTAGSPKSDFRWDRHWYAAHALDHIDPAVPHAVRILGRPMVLWRDASETWRCFLDECPHRRVPLSEGRIDEKGRLACSYHAWSFNGNGSCSCIPQASEGPESRAVNNPRSSCVAFPVKVVFGILFVWPDETSAELAESTAPPLPPGHDDPTVAFFHHVRDLPYSYEFVAENFMDPAHVPVAHHGIATLNRNQAKPLPLRLTRFDQSGYEGFTEKTESSLYPGTVEVRNEFPTPGLFTYDTRGETKGKKIRNVTGTYMAPSTPGNCRVVVSNGLPAEALAKPVFKVAGLLGFKHHMMSNLLDSDAVFLHYQEVGMNAKENQNHSWRDAYFLPTRSDLYVITFRKWLERFAHGGVKYGPGWKLRRSPGGTREQLMDRFNGHVAHCKICTEALAAYKKARVVFAAAAGICLLLLGGIIGSALTGVGAAAAPSIARPAAVLLLLAAVFGGATAFCSNNIKTFTYKGWDHARMP